MYYIFVNPASKSGNGATLWAEAEKLLKEQNVEFETHFTEKNVPITDQYNDIYSKTSERPIKLIVLGGDGTLNQVIQGITHPEETELSLIRSGSGNDFSRNKSLPTELPDIIDGILNRKHEMSIDIGLSKYSDGCYVDGSAAPDGSHRFLVSSGLGYDADICYNADHSPKLKKLLGSFIYTFFGIKNVFTTGLADMEITLDDSIELYPHVYFVAAMNQPFEGGGIPMTPDATDTDGKLDLCIFYGMSRFKALMVVPKLKAAKHVGTKGITILRSRQARITCSVPKMVHYDGETPALYKTFEASVEASIRFIY